MVIDTGGVRAKKLASRLAPLFAPSRRFMLGHKPNGADYDAADFAAMDKTALLRDFDFFTGPFQLPGIRGLIVEGDVLVIALVRDPYERALSLFIDATVSALHPLHGAVTQTTLADFAANRGLFCNAQCRQLGGAEAPAAREMLAAHTIYAPTEAVKKLGLLLEYFLGRSLSLQGLRTPLFDQAHLMPMPGKEAVGEFMRVNREDFVLHNWTRRTWLAHAKARLTEIPKPARAPAPDQR
jgi:hypothetical protein